LLVVVENRDLLRERKIFEAALVAGFIGCKHNNRDVSEEELERLFRAADRKKMRIRGRPLPGTAPFAVYRGVHGVGKERRARGLSWTASFDVACHFAAAGPYPAIYEATLHDGDIYFFTNERFEAEFVARPKTCRRMLLSAKEIRRLAKRHAKSVRDRNRSRLAAGR
jgi:hypothetical protein